MSEENLTLMCLFWPSDKPSQHIMPVEAKKDTTITGLWLMIKAAYTPALDHISTHNLVLWQWFIHNDPNLKDTLNTILFDGTHPSVQLLEPLTSQIYDFTPSNLDRMLRVLRVATSVCGRIVRYPYGFEAARRVERYQIAPRCG